MLENITQEQFEHILDILILYKQTNPKKKVCLMSCSMSYYVLFFIMIFVICEALGFHFGDFGHSGRPSGAQVGPRCYFFVFG